MSSPLCKFCEKNFSTTSNLNKHLKTCKQALFLKTQNQKVELMEKEIQDQNESFEKQLQIQKQSFQCELEGQKNAYEKKIQSLINEINLIKDIEKLENLNQKEKFEKEFQVQKQQFEKETEFLKNKVKDLENEVNVWVDKYHEKEKVAKEKEKMYNDHIRNLMSRSQTIINNNSTNVVNNVNQFMNNVNNVVKDDLYKSIDSILNNNDFLPDNIPALAQAIFSEYLKDKMVKTDSSRSVVKWKDENNNLVKDPKAVKLASKIFNVGNQLFEDKIDDLENDKRSPTLNEGVIEHINNWISLCEAMTTKSDFHIRTFGKKLADLCYDKDLFDTQSEQTIQQSESPLILWFKEVFRKETSFLMFVEGARGFANYLKNFYSDNWMFSSDNQVEFRPNRQSDWRPVDLYTFSVSVSSCLKDHASIFDNFTFYDKPIEIDGKRLDKKDCHKTMKNTINDLLDPEHKDYDLIYDIILCLE